MASPAGISGHDGARDQLLSHLRGLDPWQLEDFKLALQCPELLPEGARRIPWADLRAAGPADLLCLLEERFPGRRTWEAALRVFEDLRLSSLCERMRAELHEMSQVCRLQDPNQEEPETVEETAHRRRYRERLRTRILALWDCTPWPEDHIYLRHVTQREHAELQGLLRPRGAGAPPLTMLLEGAAGVGKTTLATKLVLHWAEGVLFRGRFSYVFYISGHRLAKLGDISFAGLLALDWPDSQVPVEEFRAHPERLLFVIDGAEEVTLGSKGSASRPGADWYQELPAASILFRLLKKELVPEATLLVTAGPPGGRALRGLLLRPCCVGIPGFTEGDRREYLRRFLGDPDVAEEAWRRMRGSETLVRLCAAPLACWAVCAGLKRQLAGSPASALALGAPTPTSLYARLFCSLLAGAEPGLRTGSSAGQWRAFCSLAAEGLWLAAFTFAGDALERWRLEAPFIDGLLRLQILRRVSDCEHCVTFAHRSFQEFFGALFYVLWGARGSLGGVPRHQEMRRWLNHAFADANPYWRQMVRFFFGLLGTDLARQLEEAVGCRMSPGVADEVLDWAEELERCGAVSGRFDFLWLFQCLHETQDENLARRVLNHLPVADLDIQGCEHLRVSSFCLKHCPKLRKLRLSVSRRVLEKKWTSGLGTPEMRVADFWMHQWEDICSVFCSGNLSELDLSNSKLSTASMMRLCLKLGNPRCRLQKLAWKSMAPVEGLRKLGLLLRGDRHLTHLDLSSNSLDAAVSRGVFRMLGHSACGLKYLWLEKGNLSAAACEDLASLLTSTPRLTRLCLGLNPLGDEGVQLLCGSLTRPECVLQRLELWCCRLSTPSCRHLSDTLLRSRSLTHLNLRRNSLGDGGVKLLSSALGRADCALQSLNLSHCSLTVAGCRELAHALKCNGHLKILDVGNNDVQDEGLKELCRVLKSPSCVLQTLGLEKCSLTAACCQLLSSVLRSSKSLENLNLLGNDLGPDGVGRLWMPLRKSTCKLRKLGLEKDLCSVVSAELEKLHEKGCFLRVKSQWDFNDPEERWWW
ncbi:NACHT, LRR and PYD domains-containing protein 13 isoform X5 [Bubalus kerabau]|uniref:NACHT, LRR and PYD domains-containing protein 13 isoform X5 n=1 Tax=Bubalus carabanensis TaxID=3119969 RepID=UPI00244EF6DD|nr:NACHT, LRR and PYD domains-containing protein 13 isoform X5 [Bubalus carabanensis]